VAKWPNAPDFDSRILPPQPFIYYHFSANLFSKRGVPVQLYLVSELALAIQVLYAFGQLYCIDTISVVCSCV